VNSTASPAYSLVGSLQNSFGSLVGNADLFLKNTEDFSSVGKCQNSEEVTLRSFDMASLFVNGPADEVLLVIESYWLRIISFPAFLLRNQRHSKDIPVLYVFVHQNEFRKGNATTFATVCHNAPLLITEVAAVVTDGTANLRNFDGLQTVIP
jgi:hypothetical protein